MGGSADAEGSPAWVAVSGSDSASLCALSREAEAPPWDARDAAWSLASPKSRSFTVPSSASMMLAG